MRKCQHSWQRWKPWDPVKITWNVGSMCGRHVDVGYSQTAVETRNRVVEWCWDERREKFFSWGLRYRAWEDAGGSDTVAKGQARLDKCNFAMHKATPTFRAQIKMDIRGMQLLDLQGRSPALIVFCTPSPTGLGKLWSSMRGHGEEAVEASHRPRLSWRRP